MDKRSGFLMIVVAILLVIISGLATAFVAMLVSNTNSSISAIAANNAYDLAEAGIENGSYQLLSGTCSSTTSTVTIAGQGQYQFSCSQKQSSTTTLTSALTTSSTSIPVLSITNMAFFGAITIDSEIIYYDGINGNTLLNAQRGQNGTTIASHVSGASVAQSQYIITSQGFSPSLSTPAGAVLLNQAVLLFQGIYYAVGTQGTNGVILGYNGAWSTALTASGVTLSGVTTSTTYGLAVGANGTTGYAYQFNGSSWVLLGTLGSSIFSDVSCNMPNNPTQCWIVGQYEWLGAIAAPLMYYTPTGASQYNLFTGSTIATTVSCLSGTCFSAISNEVFMFPINSTSPFSTGTTLGATINSVDCAQANSCVLVRSTGNVHYYNGSSWNSFSISSQSLNSVNCPTTGNCTIVGNNGVIYNCSLPITSALSCVSQTSPGTLNLLGVYCNSANDCLAVGSGSIAYRYTGAWAAISLPASYTLNAISGIGTAGGSKVVPTILHNS